MFRAPSTCRLARLAFLLVLPPVAAAHPAAEGAWLWLATGDRALLAAVKRRALEVARLDPQEFITERNTGADAANIDFGNSVLVHDLGVVHDLLHAELTAE